MADDKTGELLLALQNRINDLDAKLQATEKAQAGKSWLEMPVLDDRISKLRMEINELLIKKADVKAAVIAGADAKASGFLAACAESLESFFK